MDPQKGGHCGRRLGGARSDRRRGRCHEDNVNAGRPVSARTWCSLEHAQIAMSRTSPNLGEVLGRAAEPKRYGGDDAEVWGRRRNLSIEAVVTT